ncbi:MAG: hypothetical protein HC794_01650 [Nitrospiraceae bacterium]|nr:hypothetical protein [Nitrospiraceae bacterium]
MAAGIASALVAVRPFDEMVAESLQEQPQQGAREASFLITNPKRGGNQANSSGPSR